MPRALAKHLATKAPAAKAGIGHNRPPLPIEPLALRRREAAQVLGIGMTKLKQLIRQGKLRETRFDRASRVHVSSIRALLGEPSSNP